MKIHKNVFYLSVISVAIAACSTNGNQSTSNGVITPTPLPPMLQGKREPAVIRVTGRGTVRPDAGYTVSQMRLLAQRAARMDAYRLITEHIYGLKISGSTTVADMVVKSDQIKSSVTGYIRGAKEISSNPINGDEFTYETILEVTIDQAFFDYCFYYLKYSEKPCVDGNGPTCNGQYQNFYINR